MNFTKSTAIILLLTSAAAAQEPKEPPAAREVTGMLRQFLVDAGSGNRAGFEKFFADDLIYTRAAGVVITKAEILKRRSPRRKTRPPTRRRTSPFMITATLL